VHGWDTLVLLKHYLESGLSKTAIARQLGVSRRAIYHWIQTGQLDRELSGTAPVRQRMTNPLCISGGRAGQMPGDGCCGGRK
jgi:hypothetical protein